MEVYADNRKIHFSWIGLSRTVFELALTLAVVILATRPPASYAMPWNDQLVHSVPTKEKIVALTFDDGPHPTFTPQILQILNKYHTRATFFMIGERMVQYPDIVKDVVASENVIGNHTYTHPKDIQACTQAQLIRELDQCEQVIEQMTGKRTHIFRPPKGLVDGDVLLIAKEEGYRTILWTVSADHHDAPTPEMMAERVLKRVRPGAIILAHDGTFPSRWRDVRATELIITALQKQGYRFVTIPELLEAAARPQRLR